MKIGDRVFVRGYIDEIRKDTVIVRNDGGYFGTIPSEVITGALPSAQPDPNCSEIPNNSDTISRQAAIDALDGEITVTGRANAEAVRGYARLVADRLKRLPSVQPERTCVNCGRTANNGGWYEDGRTRCPIEEHYALPKDGYCHLWEKRKDWEDAYVKRAEEGEK